MSQQRENRGTGRTAGVRPDTAGAHGSPEGEIGRDSSGLSDDKGVHGTGDPSKPTSSGEGLRVGESEWEAPTGEARDHTLDAQLRDKGFADGENAPADDDGTEGDH